MNWSPTSKKSGKCRRSSKGITGIRKPEKSGFFWCMGKYEKERKAGSSILPGLNSK
jgi:hypothetical protein